MKDGHFFGERHFEIHILFVKTLQGFKDRFICDKMNAKSNFALVPRRDLNSQNLRHLN